MVVNKRKKFSRQRGTHTHGWGSKKKHRGSGNRGGFGMAGTGKRADQIKTLIWKDKHYFGKYGFIPKGIKEKIKAINIDFIEENLNKFLIEGLASKQEGFYLIDLEKLGYNKLLGNGRINNKYRIKAKYASGNAIEKIKQFGGEVILDKKEEISSSE